MLIVNFYCKGMLHIFALESVFSK